MAWLCPRHFLKETGSQDFTDTCEDLHGLKQHRGTATDVRRLLLRRRRRLEDRRTRSRCETHGPGTRWRLVVHRGLAPTPEAEVRCSAHTYSIRGNIDFSICSEIGTETNATHDHQDIIPQRFRSCRPLHG